MRVLYLTNGDAHGHDYGIDYLFDGLARVCGYDNVIDWPARPSLHLDENDQLDACLYDSDQRWPRRDVKLWDHVPSADLVILSVQPGHNGAQNELAPICKTLPRHLPIVAVDTSDSCEDTSAWYTQLAGRPLAAYFKRELPIGCHWALPLPLTYPSTKVPDFVQRDPKVFYVAESHGINSPGVPRKQIVEDLKHLPQNLCDMRLYHGHKERLHPEEYHAAMARSLIGVSWNGAHNWDCNRFWEHFAFGLCQVAEEPRIRIPYKPQHGVHCFYVGRPEEVGPLVQWLLSSLDTAAKVAQQGHAWFMQHHTSEARARHLLACVGALA